MENYIKAEKYLSDAITQYSKTLDPDHPYIALSQYWLGKIYLETERFDRAEDFLRESLKTRAKKLPMENKDIWRSKTELGICLFKLKKYDEAETLLPSTLEYYKTNFPDDTDQLTRLYDYTVNLYSAMGNKQLAEKYEVQSKSFSR